MDRYLDSLFDPVLSDSSIVSADTNHMLETLSTLLWIDISLLNRHACYAQKYCFFYLTWADEAGFQSL